MDETPSLRPGQLIDGKYEIIGLLGSGSMGLVYTAKHTTLNRTVALKTLRHEISMDEELVGRFQQEARAAGALGHPNIVQIFDAGQTFSGIHYIVMEQLDGRSLYELMELQPLFSPGQAVAIMQQVLSALSVAHRRGIVHRDLKPENIFIARTDLGQEQVKLLDFGISKVLERAEEGIRGADAATRATKMGVVMGTPLYMSPEQARGDLDIDHRADLWSASCVLYEMLCGRTPYDGDNYNQVMVAILDDDFVLPRKLRPDIPAPLEAVILRGKAFDRDRRYADAEAMRDELMAAMGTTSSTHVQSFSVDINPGEAPRGTRAMGSGTPAPELLSPAHAPGTPAPDSVGLSSGSQALSLAKSDSGLSDDEAKMLNALDNLGSVTVGSLDDDPSLDEIGVASTLTPVPGSLVGVEPPGELDLDDSMFELGDPLPAQKPASAAAPPPAAPAADRFAPPGGPPPGHDPFAAPVGEFETEAIELREDVLREVAPARVNAPAPRRPPGTMYKPRGAGIGSLFTWLFVLALLGGGGFAAYRYYTLGYILPRSTTEPTRISFTIVPEDAEVLVNDELLITRPFEAEAGVEYKVTLRALGRLRVERKLEAVEGKTENVRVRLPLAISAIDKATARSYVVPETDSKSNTKPSYDAIDGALLRLDLYTQCLKLLAEPVSASEEAYTKSTRTRITNKTLPIIRPIDTKLGLECQTLLDVAKDRAAPMTEIHELAQSYLDALGPVMRLLSSLDEYYSSEAYKQDRLKKGREAHAKLEKLFPDILNKQRKLVSLTLAARRRWQLAELAALEAQDGRTTHWYVRRLVLASQEWVLAELGQADPELRKTRRADFDTAFVSAQENIRKGAKGVRLAEAYVSAVGAVAAQSGEEALRWHNDSVALFNKIIVTGSPGRQ